MTLHRRTTPGSVLIRCVGVIALPALPATAQNCEWMWEPIGTNGIVFAMIVFDDGSGPALYAGGSFGAIGGVSSPYLARFDGRDWMPVGGGVNGNVRALAIHDDGSGPALLVGGRLSMAGGVAVDNVAKWDGKSWSPVGNGITDAEDTVLCLASVPGPQGATLYVGGYFTYAGGQLVESIAQLVDGQWTAMDGGFYGAPYALAAFDDGSGSALYAVGTFSKAGGEPIKDLARWNGLAWSDPGASLSQPTILWAVLARTEISGPALYAGGIVDRTGQDIANGIVRWDGAGWSGLGSGLGVYGTSFALASYPAEHSELLIAGGDFGEAGGRRARNLAAWDGQLWSAVGLGTDDYIWSLATIDFGDGPILFVGGWFEEAGGLYSPNLAMVRCIPVCRADCDGSGSLDLFDFLCFNTAFEAADPKADCDASGSLDFFDYLCFANSYNAGCP